MLLKALFYFWFKMSLTFIGGINGVGKTSVAELICNLEPTCEVVKGSDVMMERLGIKGDYDAFRSMNENIKNTEFIKLLSELKNKPSKTIVTGHFVKILDGTLSPSLGPWYDICDNIVLLISNPKMVLKRIQSDDMLNKRTNRRLFSEYMKGHNLQVAFLNNAQDLSRSIFEHVSENQSLKTASFYNRQGNLYDCSAQIISFMNSL